MLSIYLIELIFLLIIPLLVYGKSTLRSVTEDPKTDYIFHEEGSGDVPTNSVESTTSKAAGLEIEDSFPTLTNSSTLEPSENSNAIETSKPIANITTDQNSLTSSCSLDAEALRTKVSDIMGRHMPSVLKLKTINRGFGTRLMLENGRLSVNTDFKLVGQPICEPIDEETKKYDFMVSFQDLVGFYDWKIYNLFGNDFSESAIISMKRLKAEFVFVEDSKEKTRLKDVKIGSIDDLNVKVNVPENITRITLLKQMMQYVMSRITTMIVNRSKEMITTNMQNILSDAIKEKTFIKP